jgi:hypothetical protein
MIAERGVEGGKAPFRIGILAGLDLVEQVGMRAQRPLRERDQRARENVGALDRDADRDHEVRRLEVVRWAIADAAAAVQIHGVVDRLAQPLGRLVLHDCGDDGGLFAARHHRSGDGTPGLVDVRRLDHAGQRLFEALHLGDGEAELLADTAVGGGETEHRLGAGGA